MFKFSPLLRNAWQKVRSHGAAMVAAMARKCRCHKCSCEHFHVIAAEKPLPLPHCVNGPKKVTSSSLFLSRVKTL